MYFFSLLDGHFPRLGKAAKIKRLLYTVVPCFGASAVDSVGYNPVILALCARRYFAEALILFDRYKNFGVTHCRFPRFLRL